MVLPSYHAPTMRKKKLNSKSEVIGIKDSKGLKAELQRIADAEDRSLSSVVRRALRREINENGIEINLKGE